MGNTCSWAQRPTDETSDAESDHDGTEKEQVVQALPQNVNATTAISVPVLEYPSADQHPATIPKTLKAQSSPEVVTKPAASPESPKEVLASEPKPLQQAAPSPVRPTSPRKEAVVEPPVPQKEAPPLKAAPEATKGSNSYVAAPPPKSIPAPQPAPQPASPPKAAPTQAEPKAEAKPAPKAAEAQPAPKEETKPVKAAPPATPAKQWTVIGGADTGGIIVRKGADLKSDALDRLSTGSVIKEIGRGDAGRIQYQKLSGTGPFTGWISETVKGKPMVVSA